MVALPAAAATAGAAAAWCCLRYTFPSCDDAVGWAEELCGGRGVVFVGYARSHVLPAPLHDDVVFALVELKLGWRTGPWRLVRSV